MAVVVGFQLRGVRRGATEAVACGRGNTAGLTLILDRGQFFLAEDMSLSFAVFWVIGRTTVSES